MFTVTIGKDGLSESWQAPFPETTDCVHCKKEARVGFVVKESRSDEPRKAGEGPEAFVSHMHPNDPDGEGYWLHDACAVAVYFCKKCLNPTAIYNQG